MQLLCLDKYPFGDSVNVFAVPCFWAVSLFVNYQFGYPLIMPLSLTHLVSTAKNWGTEIDQSVERLGAKIPSISATCFSL